MSKNIICIGDSITYGYSVSPANRWTNIVGIRTGYNLINRGICGDTTAGMLSRLDNELASKPDYALIIGGTNDIFIHCDAKAAQANIMSMLFKCADTSVSPILATPPPIIFGCISLEWSSMVNDSKTPVVLDDYVNWIRHFAKTNNISLIDLHKFILEQENFAFLYIDGIHLNAHGNKLLADRISLSLLNICQ